MRPYHINAIKPTQKADKPHFDGGYSYGLAGLSHSCWFGRFWNDNTKTPLPRVNNTLDRSNIFHKKSERHFATLRYRFRFSCFDKVGKALTYLENSSFVMRIEGIIVTHNYTKNSWDTGVGVYVTSGGTLIMSDGKISGNHVGVFVYYGGAFSMIGGEISNNYAYAGGGGVYNLGSFNLSAGVVANNTANEGGGVFSMGSFVISGGVVANNTAFCGGGVGVKSGSFVLYDGEISDNAVRGNGGGVHVMDSFVMYGGEISGNIANKDGGGVSILGSFNMLNGKITANQADRNGGGVFYFFECEFNRSGGKISNNNAISNGNIAT